jgi:hypothetical protein
VAENGGKALTQSALFAMNSTYRPTSYQFRSSAPSTSSSNPRYHSNRFNPPYDNQIRRPLYNPHPYFINPIQQQQQQQVMQN